MLYLANPSTSAVRELMAGGVIGCMASPAQGSRIDPSWTWAVDNDCFAAGPDWSAGKWIAYLERNREHAGRCLFAAVPDRVADAAETMRRWRIWAPVVAELGYRPAFVLQDDQPAGLIPWEEFDVLFVGGSTVYKLSDDAYRISVDAHARGKRVHWGRVNSRRRFAMAALSGDSCDGTFLVYGPDTNLPRLLSWVNVLDFTAENGRLTG